MLKRLAAWLRGIHWLAGGIAAAMLALAVAWVLFVPAADWLAHHDAGSAKGSLHETAVDNARGRLLTLGAGLFAAGALIFTARNFTLSRQQLELAQRAMRLTEIGQQRTLELTEQGQVTDRYTKAIEQLGSGKVGVRIGGIYALERIARDSAKDHPAVMEVLTAFIRERPPLDHPADGEQERSARPDVQAAVTVVGRRDAKRDVQRIDLTRADLTDAIFRGPDPTATTADGAALNRAILNGATLRGADLMSASLNGADLRGADLTDAILWRARLQRATLTDADLSGAILIGVDLTNADLTGAILTGAILNPKDFTSAHRRRVTFFNEVHPGLLMIPNPILTGALWPADTPVPESWKPDADSGRLERR